jgi:hypothetical protein
MHPFSMPGVKFDRKARRNPAPLSFVNPGIASGQAASSK